MKTITQETKEIINKLEDLRESLKRSQWAARESKHYSIEDAILDIKDFSKECIEDLKKLK